MLRCTNDLLEPVATATGSQFVSGVAVQIMMFTGLLPLFLDPPREATDPRFDFHVLFASNKSWQRGKDDVMIVLVSVFFVALLSEQTTSLAITLPEFVPNGATMPELPEGLLQLPVSVGLLFVEPQAGFLQLRERVAKRAEVNLRSDGGLLGNIFDPERKS